MHLHLKSIEKCYYLQNHRNMLLIANEKYSPKDEPPLELLARTTPNASNKVFQNQVEQEGTCAKERKKS